MVIGLKEIDCRDSPLWENLVSLLPSSVSRVTTSWPQNANTKQDMACLCWISGRKYNEFQ